MKNIKRITVFALTLALMLIAAGCGSKNNTTKENKVETEANQTEANKTEENATEANQTEAKQTEAVTELTVLAAASLTDVMNELGSMYEADHEVKLTFSFAGSGTLQTQIEEGAPADIFISAALKQMNALKDQKLMKDDTVVNLLENKVVLIVPKDSTLALSSFEDVKNDDVTMIGLGEVESVPAGKYAETIFTNLGMWEEVKNKANFGTDVRTVLGWVETSAVSCGVVYATDAYSSEDVKIVAEAPAESCDPVIYPAGVTASSAHAGEAEEFLSFLASEEAMKVFEKYGFVRAGE